MRTLRDASAARVDRHVHARGGRALGMHAVARRVTPETRGGMAPRAGEAREGCQNVDPSCCGEVVFAQEAAESVASREFRVWGWRRWRRVREWWVAAECAVWALGVVVVYVDA
jgi:hypothetical protein